MAVLSIENFLNDAGFFDGMAEDVREGLTASPKWLPPKYFYDERGSELFERITEQPEYYPMREEAKLLQEIASEVMTALSPQQIVELGSGSSTKTRVLLDAGRDAETVGSYVAFDVSESIVREAGESLQKRYPDLAISGIVGDFHRHLDKIPEASGQRLVLFLGGTIGNLHPQERGELLAEIGQLLGDDGYLLLGTDLVKETATIERAYNDSAGVTAAFNRNMLHVINNGLEGDFEPEAFEHMAFFNEESSRIEMHLKPRVAQVATLRSIGLRVEVGTDETIWTECSYKFTRRSVEEMLRGAGMELRSWYAAPGDRFALSLACAM